MALVIFAIQAWAPQLIAGVAGEAVAEGALCEWVQRQRVGQFSQRSGITPMLALEKLDLTSCQRLLKLSFRMQGYVQNVR